MRGIIEEVISDCKEKTVVVRYLYIGRCEKVPYKEVHVSDSSLSEPKEFVWHRRYGHLNERSLHTMASQNLVYDFDRHTSDQYHSASPVLKVNSTERLFEIQEEGELRNHFN